jgi:hypothetical protein
VVGPVVELILASFVVQQVQENTGVLGLGTMRVLWETGLSVSTVAPLTSLVLAAWPPRGGRAVLKAYPREGQAATSAVTPPGHCAPGA